MIKEIFDKLRRCDKMIKQRHSNLEMNPSAIPDNKNNIEPPFPDQTMRWMHTVLQLINYRFIRFLKYSPLSSGMFHYIRYSISHLEHRQVYHVLESFVLNTIKSQIDIKVLRSLDDPNRDKPIWFAESEKLARSMVWTIARLIKTRGQADIKTEQIHRVLANLYEHQLQWSPETLQYFPAAVQTFYSNSTNGNNNDNQKSLSVRSSVSIKTINQFVTANQTFINYLQQGVAENERSLLQFFSTLEYQPFILCSLWMFAITRSSMEMFYMPSVRKLLLLIPPSRMATCIIDFVDFMLSMDYSSTSSSLRFQLLEVMIWKHQWVNFNDVIMALLNGNSTSDRADKAFEFVRYLLFQSNEFEQRVLKWDSLQFSSRSWTEENGFDKLMEYQQMYPEFYEFEAFAAASGNLMNLDPPCQTPMPTYHTNVIIDFVTTMESIITHLIEHNQPQLLGDILEKYGHLFHYHQYPLSFVCSILLYYYSAPAIKDHPLNVKRITRLLGKDNYI